MTDTAQTVNQTSVYSGEVAFRWMESSVRPTDAGVYDVVYDILGQPARGRARFANNTWTHDIEGIGPLFKFWLLQAELPLPPLTPPVVEATAEPGVPESSPNHTSFRVQVDAYRASEGYTEDFLTDGQTLVYLQILSRVMYEDVCDLVSMLDPQGHHTAMNTPEGIEEAKQWVVKVMSDLEEREFISLADGIAVSLTFQGMDVVQNGIDSVDSPVSVDR